MKMVSFFQKQMVLLKNEFIYNNFYAENILSQKEIT